MKMEVLSHKEFPFPDDLEGRVNSIANIVNTELKVATLLHLDGTLAEGNEILARIRDTVGGGVRLTSGPNLSAYCHHSLLPIGAVAEEEVMRDTGETIYIGYRITEAGRRYGLPIAVFSLNWGVDNGLSLYSILGSTASSGKSRSPLNRINILKRLRRGPLREVDLSNDLELANYGVNLHLKNLQKIGFVDYKSIPEPHEAKGSFNYRYAGKEGTPEAVKEMKILTIGVLGSMKKLGTADYIGLAKELNHPLHTISTILSGLEKQGFLKIVGDFKARERYSKAEITDFGKRFVDEYVAVIEDALNDCVVLSKLQNQAEGFLAFESSINYLVRGINNYWRVSPRGNARPSEETKERIVDYIRRNSGARLRDIKRDFRVFLPNYLSHLVKTGILEKRKIDEENKSAVGYFVIKED